MFTPCGPLCIAHNGCDGRCCDAPSFKPAGAIVAVATRETERIASLGGTVENGLLQCAGGCPFKTHEGLCSIHDRGKPFGCIASPFTVNANGTLVIRNRYKLLPCYKGAGGPMGIYRLPAYIAFYPSLVAIFGERVAKTIRSKLEQGSEDFHAPALFTSISIIEENRRTHERIKERR